jgi:hypothetical protein
VYVSPLGKKIYTSGTYNETLKSILGCDSIKYTLNVSIVNVNAQVTRDWNTLISSASAASYRWLDCKNSLTFISGETNKEFTPTASGQFAVEVTQSGCLDTSTCVTFAWTDINKPLKASVKLMPNPNSGRFQLELDQQISNVHAQIFNVNGKLVWEENWQQLLKKEISVELVAGFYIIRLDSDSGSWINKLKVE